MKKYAYLPCNHRSEFCALCSDRPLKTRAEERLIRAALRFLTTGPLLEVVERARAVAREHEKGKP